MFVSRYFAMAFNSYSRLYYSSSNKTTRKVVSSAIESFLGSLGELDLLSVSRDGDADSFDSFLLSVCLLNKGVFSPLNVTLGVAVDPLLVPSNYFPSLL